MIDWSTTAFVFPGQGSQEIGMGKSYAATYPAARQVFEQANDILGFDLADMCFNGPETLLNETINTQPALYVCGIAIYETLRQLVPDAVPLCVAGHSLGEFTALTAAGVLSFEDGLRLVQERGRLMQQAGEINPGAMAAILGLDASVVVDICQQARQQVGGDLVLANDNTVGQVVISGHEATLKVGMQMARDAGARKAVKLAVSIAAHSPLMQSVTADFDRALAACTLSESHMPVYGNVTAAPMTTADAVRDELSRQLTSPVLWTETMRRMLADGVTTVIELGPKDVLCGLMKRLDRQIIRISLSETHNLSALSANHGD